MSSPAQVLANRENATKSLGPTSPEGKAISSANRRSHGLTERFTMFEEEDAGSYRQLLSALQEEYKPATENSSCWSKPSLKTIGSSSAP